MAPRPQVRLPDPVVFQLVAELGRVSDGDRGGGEGGRGGVDSRQKERLLPVLRILCVVVVAVQRGSTEGLDWIGKGGGIVLACVVLACEDHGESALPPPEREEEEGEDAEES